MENKYIESTLELMDFIQDSPSVYHVVENVAKILDNAGATELKEEEPYVLEMGHSYFVRRNNSALISWKMTDLEPSGYSIVAAHTDSPSFKIKDNPEILNGNTFTTLNVEAYGGMIMAPWFDRPLSIAGRAFVKEEDGSISERLVDFDKDLCQIVNLCIHQNRDINKGYEYKVQKDMLPILSMGDQDNKGQLRSLVSENLEVEESSILDMELFLYNRMAGSIWGANDEFFSCPRIDDLQCAYSSLKAFVEAEPSKSNKIQVLCLFDNEEVGSSTRQGAAGDFLSQTISRIECAMKWDYQ
ncbi:MAG: M18 family aminopeptidase, partial [Sphaerochaetaceae bacterium]|nr:M18 family aminopeptidase [Sphaerochaetaceae bacterium]